MDRLLPWTGQTRGSRSSRPIPGGGSGRVEPNSSPQPGSAGSREGSSERDTGPRIGYIFPVILPLRRDALKERGHLDEADEDATFARSTPSQRLELSVELSDVTRSLAESVGSDWVLEARMALESKADLYVAPMRALLGRRP